MTDKVPDHSFFSQNHRRRFSDSEIFSEIFNHIVRLCIEKRIVTGESVVSDGSFIPANISSDSIVELNQEVKQSPVHYLDALDEELRQQPGYKEPISTIKEKTVVSSTTDTDCGYINQEHKKGLGYLAEMTVDTGNGIVVGVGLVHRGLEILGITGYVSCIDFSYDILRRNLKYIPGTDCFECPAGKFLNFIKLTYKKSTQNYYRLYRMSAANRKSCFSCDRRKECAFSHSDTRINASPFYPAFYRSRKRYETPMYKAMKRLRGI